MSNDHKHGPPVRIDPEKIPPIRPARVDPERLAPLPEALQELKPHCALCDKPGSVWHLRTPHKDGADAYDFLCSLCLLYRTSWGRQNKRQIQRVVKGIEDHGGFVFERRRKNRLARLEDADRIAGAIVLTSRMFDLQDRKARFEEYLRASEGSGDRE